MLDIQGAVWSRLNSDATLLAMLAAYGAGKALLSDPVPDDIEVTSTAPVCIVSSPISNEAADDFSSDYREASVLVRLYNQPDGSTIELETAAERARAFLKSWPAGAVTGGSLVSATVSGPVSGPTDDPSLEGRILTVRLLLQET